MKLARSVFFVTDPISAGFSPDKEFQMGKNGVDAALEVRDPASSPPPPLSHTLAPLAGGGGGGGGERGRGARGQAAMGCDIVVHTVLCCAAGGMRRSCGCRLIA